MLQGLIIALSLVMLIAGLLCLAVKRYGSPLNSPPSTDDLAKLDRIFAGTSDTIRLGFLRNRLDGSKESLFLGSPEHLDAVQDRLRNFLATRASDKADTGAMLKFDSTRRNKLLQCFLAAAYAGGIILMVFVNFSFIWLTFLASTANLFKSYVFSAGKITNEAIILGRTPFRKCIPYAAVTATRIDLENGVGFFLEIVSEIETVRIYHHKLGKILKLHDTIVGKQAELLSRNNPSEAPCPT